MIAMYLMTCVISSALVRRYQQFALRHQIVDVPNSRSSHQAITARGGGIVFVGIWLSIFVLIHTTGLIGSSFFFSIYYPTIMVALVSCLDDAISVKARYRLLVHLLASVFALASLSPLHITVGHFLIPASLTLYFFCVLFLSWSVNAYNFMDGLDGLAAFQSVFISLVSAAVLFHAHQFVLAQLYIFLGMSVLGFLVWNGPWPRASIFMGDVGSASLGLILPLLSLESQSEGIDGLIFLMLYFPFLFDTTVTLIRRVLGGSIWYLPHREHAFQRLHRFGWPHHAVLVGLIIMDSVIGVMVLSSVFFPEYIWYCFILELLAVGFAYLSIEYHSPMGSGPRR